jgi:competence protein ComEA
VNGLSSVLGANRPKNYAWAASKVFLLTTVRAVDYCVVAGGSQIFQGGVNLGPIGLQNRVSRILCAVGLAVALTVVPASWAFASPQRSGQARSRASAHSAITHVDINTATADQLKSLPGMGDVYARRIIAGRPYHSKDQLVSKGILPRSVYDNIKNNLIAHQIKK